jgi:RNA-dependent RNA polymerase
MLIEGEIMIAKNPSLYPGDIRKVTAKRDERLSYLKNVLVFNQKGRQSLPSLISSSDLDGDEYYVLFDQELIFKAKNKDALD